MDHVPFSAQLDAFDIDTSQCPPREWLPKNVSIESLDVFQDVPVRFLESYDVIHIRYFACVVRNNDPGAILQNVLRMLSEFPLLILFSQGSCKPVNLLLTSATLIVIEPGGYLQWSEQDYESQEIVVAERSINPEPFTTVKQEFESQSGLKVDAFR